MSFVLDSLSGFYDKGRSNIFQINADLKTPQTMDCQDFQRFFIKNNAMLVILFNKIREIKKNIIMTAKRLIDIKRESGEASNIGTAEDGLEFALAKENYVSLAGFAIVAENKQVRIPLT